MTKNYLSLPILSLTAILFLCGTCNDTKVINPRSFGSSPEPSPSEQDVDIDTPGEDNPTTPQLDTEPFTFMMARSGCYGKCPVYSIRIKSDGTLIYLGQKFVKDIGKFQGALSPEQINFLRAELENSGFASLPNRFPKDDRFIISDFPTTKTTLKRGDAEYQVMNHNTIDTDNESEQMGHQKLSDLEQFIDDLVKSTILEQVNEEE